MIKSRYKSKFTPWLLIDWLCPTNVHLLNKLVALHCCWTHEIMIIIIIYLFCMALFRVHRDTLQVNIFCCWFILHWNIFCLSFCAFFHDYDLCKISTGVVSVVYYCNSTFLAIFYKTKVLAASVGIHSSIFRHSTCCCDSPDKVEINNPEINS